MISSVSVVVVIPMYKKDMSPQEYISLKNIYSTFAGSRPMVVVKPLDLDLSHLHGEFPLLTFEDFDSGFFKGIKGYNRLMTSTDFYFRFTSWKYVLIAQLDTYFFRDDLDRWCEKGYDYVGAPWLCRPLNKFPLIAWMNRWKDAKRRKKGLYEKVFLYNKVGNGGLSLRKVESHLRIASKYKDELARLNEIGPKGQPEDVFWACLEQEFSYPSAMEALEFSFDKYPKYSYKLMNGKLPMGCHVWYSRKMRKFWDKLVFSNVYSLKNK